MATTSNTVELIFRANNQATAGINRIAADVQQLGRSIETGPLGSLSRLSSAFTSIAGAAGVGFLIQGFRKAIEAAGEADRSFRQLSNSIELAGGSIQRDGQTIQTAIARLFDTTTYDDEALQDALSSLITRTGDVSSALKALPVAADLAAKAGMDLQSAVGTIGLAAEGATRGLKQLGISFTEAQQKAFTLMDEGKRLEIVLGLINERVSGAARANVESYGGALSQASKDLKEVWEAVGGAIFWATSKMDAFFLGFRQHIIDAQRRTPSLIDAIRHALQGEFRARGSWEPIISGGSFTPASGVVSGDAARAALDAGAANVKAAETAKKATREWTSDVDALRESFTSLSRNMAIVTANFGDSQAAVSAYMRDIIRLADEAERLGVTLPAALARAAVAARELQASLLGELPLGRSIGQFMAEQERIRELQARQGSPVLNVSGLNAALEPIYAQQRAEMIRAAEEAAERFTERFRQPIGDIFTDLALTGGQNFGRIAGQMFADVVRDFADQFIDLIGRGLQSILGTGGAAVKTGTTATGEPVYSYGGQTGLSEEQVRQLQAQRANEAGAMIGQGLGGAFGLYGAIARPNLQSDFGTVLSGTLGGAALGGAVAGAISGSIVPGLGTIIGAAVGLIAGAISAMLSSVGDEYAYARFGVRAGGEAFFDPRQNITANAAREAQSRLQQAYDTAIGDLTRTLMRFPLEVLPRMIASIGDVLPRVGLEVGGDIGRAASANFWKHFSEWMEAGMPRQLAARFEPVFEQAFTGMGFTIARFQEIWDSLQDLDPAQARQLLDQWAQAAAELPEAFEFLNRPFADRGGMLDWADRENRRTPADLLTDEFRDIERLARTLADMPLSQQITGWAEVKRLTQEVRGNVEQFMRDLAEGIRQVTESFQADIRSLELAGIRTPEGEPDFQRQAEYLRGHLQQLYGSLATAVSPTEAQSIGEQIRAVIGQIYGIGQQLGPEAGEEFRNWALQALRQGETEVIAQMRRLGEEVAARANEWTERIQGEWEQFTGAAGAALGDFTDAIGDAIDRIRDFPGGGGGGGSGDTPAPPPIIVQPGEAVVGLSSATSEFTRAVGGMTGEFGRLIDRMSKVEAPATPEVPRYVEEARIGEAFAGLVTLGETAATAIEQTSRRTADVLSSSANDSESSAGRLAATFAGITQAIAGLGTEDFVAPLKESLSSLTSTLSANGAASTLTNIGRTLRSALAEIENIPTDDPGEAIRQLNGQLGAAVSAIGDISADDATQAFSRARDRIKASFVDLATVSGDAPARAIGETAEGIRASLTQLARLRPPAIEIPEIRLRLPKIVAPEIPDIVLRPPTVVVPEIPDVVLSPPKIVVPEIPVLRPPKIEVPEIPDLVLRPPKIVVPEIPDSVRLPIEPIEAAITQVGEGLRRALSTIGGVGSDEAVGALARARDQIKAAFLDFRGISGDDAARVIGATAEAIRTALLQIERLQAPKSRAHELTPTENYGAVSEDFDNLRDAVSAIGNINADDAASALASATARLKTSFIDLSGISGDVPARSISDTAEAIRVALLQVERIRVPKEREFTPPPPPREEYATSGSANSGGAFAGAMLTRLERIESALGVHIARSTQILSGDLGAVRGAIENIPPTQVIVPSAPTAQRQSRGSPSSRVGRQL